MGLRVLSLFGKMTIIETFLIPKLLYVSTIMETPKEIIKQMERMIDKFLFKGPNKVTRLSVINSLQNGGLNLTNLETQIKPSGCPGFHEIGILLLKCNYDVKDLNLTLNRFYRQLPIWWAGFRNAFSQTH